jgi:hypothetical protein
VSDRRGSFIRYALCSLIASSLLFAGFAGTTLGANPSGRATPAASDSRAALRRLAAAYTVHLGFEKSVRGWFGFGTGTRVTAIHGTAKSGSRSLQTRVTLGTRAAGAGYDGGHRGVAVLASTSYTFVAWIKGEGRLHMKVGFHSVKGHALRPPRIAGSGKTFVPRRSRWHRYVIRFETPARASSAVLRVGTLGRARATFFVDAVSLRPNLGAARTRHSGGQPAPTTTARPAPTTTSTTAPPAAPTAAASPAAPGASGTTKGATATTSTTGAGAPTYDSAIAYTATRPPFNVLREVDVSSQAQLETAVANIRAGDLVKATSGFAVDGEFQISVNPSGPAEIDLGTGADAVRFSYTGSIDLPSVWIVNASNLRIFGGDLHGAPPGQVGGGELTVYRATNILWWGFHIHDVPGNGLNLAPVYGPITGCDLQGEIDHWGQNTSGDPHAEKGTGIHAANIADVTGSVYTNNRLALYAHDGPAGAAIQIGNPDATGEISGDTIILKAVNLTKTATSQVAGNALQEWGGVPMQITVPYLEATNLTGRGVDTNGVYGGVSQAGVKIVYGRAHNTNLNPYLAQTESSISPATPWDPRHGNLFVDTE